MALEGLWWGLRGSEGLWRGSGRALGQLWWGLVGLWRAVVGSEGVWLGLVGLWWGLVGSEGVWWGSCWLWWGSGLPEAQSLTHSS